MMKYLYTGHLPEHGTCEARRCGLVEMGREVITLSYKQYFKNYPFFGTLGRKYNSFQTIAGFGPSIWKYNKSLLSAVRKHHPDIVWIDKGHYIFQSTLKAIKKEIGSLLVCYNTDDIFFGKNGWRLHFQGIKEYDVYFTTNRYNVNDLKSLGARCTILTQIGYNRDLFRPSKITKEEESRLGATIGFIGHWEKATENIISQIIKTGLPVRIRGNAWEKARSNKYLKNVIEPGFVQIEDYPKAIIATMINLGINSAQNRNLSSGRTFEITATGGFLLAQRTEEHKSFFKEGIEAEYFESTSELAEKAHYYLKCDKERKQIADAGYNRCISSGYSWQELMVGMVHIAEDFRIRK